MTDPTQDAADPTRAGDTRPERLPSYPPPGYAPHQPAGSGTSAAAGPQAGGGGTRPSPAGTAVTEPIPAPAAQSPTRPARRRGRTRRGGMGPVVAVAAVAGLVGGLGGGVLSQTIQQRPSPPTQQVSGPGGPDRGSESTGSQDELVSEDLSPAPVLAGPGGDIASLARAVLPSVALISIAEDGLGVVGQGSGFVIREDGYLLTNHHVIAGAQQAQILVEFPGQEPLVAEVVGSDQVYDIAVLRIDRAGLEALPFADASVVEVGQTVVAVGAPLGLDSTVTSGIISAIDRPVVAGQGNELSYINAVQTDAAINPGNSGGPLLDLAGRVVGVNSAIAQLPSMTVNSPSGSIGLGFAIPAEQAARTAQQLIETGSSQHPVMGVHIDLEYSGDGARVLGQERDEVIPIIPGGPAEAAGVRPGDTIIEVDGTRIRDAQHLLVLLRSREVGERIELLLEDAEGAQRTVSLVLAGSGG